MGLGTSTKAMKPLLRLRSIVNRVPGQGVIKYIARDDFLWRVVRGGGDTIGAVFRGYQRIGSNACMKSQTSALAKKGNRTEVRFGSVRFTAGGFGFRFGSPKKIKLFSL